MKSPKPSRVMRSGLASSLRSPMQLRRITVLFVWHDIDTKPMSFGGQTFYLADFLECAIAPGALPSEITVRKVFRVLKPLRLKLSGSFDINTQEFRTKASLKVRSLP